MSASELQTFQETIHVLMVEDDPNYQFLMSQFLKESKLVDFKITHTNCLSKALDILSKQSFDVVVLDLSLLDSNGIDTFFSVHQRIHKIPIIVMTTYNDEALAVQIVEAGAQDYLVKGDVKHGMLIRSIRYAIKRKKIELQLEEQKRLIQQQTLALKRHNDEMKEDLELAIEFQHSILPEVRDCAFLKITSRYIPYGGVSGDVYDLDFNRDGALNIFLGDATGHGIAAGFMTMMVQIALDNLRADVSTAEAIRTLNHLFASRETGKFITGAYLRVSPKGELKVTLAGHLPIVIIPEDGSEPVLLSHCGLALGIFFKEVVPYKEEHYQLQVGDKFFVYTDGFIEWMNDKHELFGQQRFVNFLSANRNSDLDTILNDLMVHIKEFAKGVRCQDDLTILAFQYFSNH
ncbi:fused response regulator/phosphatase [Deltaproteobacteria bacterium TL4]